MDRQRAGAGLQQTGIRQGRPRLAAIHLVRVRGRRAEVEEGRVHRLLPAARCGGVAGGVVAVDVGQWRRLDDVKREMVDQQPAEPASTAGPAHARQHRQGHRTQPGQDQPHRRLLGRVRSGPRRDDRDHAARNLPDDLDEGLERPVGVRALAAGQHEHPAVHPRRAGRADGIQPAGQHRDGEGVPRLRLPEEQLPQVRADRGLPADDTFGEPGDDLRPSGRCRDRPAAEGEVLPVHQRRLEQGAKRGAEPARHRDESEHQPHAGTQLAAADSAIVRMTSPIVAGADQSAPATARALRPGQRGGSGLRRFLRALSPLWWLGPTLLLMALIIIYPAIEMIRTSFLKVNSIGLSQGTNGLANFRQLFAEPALGHVIANTVLWVLLVVAVTILISLALAQYLNKRFAGRRFVRLALVVVGIIVSLPIISYVLLAGLQAVPGDLYDVARVDGGGPFEVYRRVTLPLLKPALLVSVVLNTIYVFNSFPIIWVITGKIPGNSTDTTITFMYKVAFTYRLNVGEAAALSVLNVLFLILVVSFYLRRVRWTETGEHAVVTGGKGADGSVTGRVARGWRAALRERLSAIAGRAASAARGATAPASRTLAVVGRALAVVGRALAVVGRALARAWSPVRSAGLPAVGLVVAAFFLAPYAVMFLSALKSNNDLFHSPALYVPTHWEWGNFASVWSKIPLAAYLINSLVIAGVATVIVLTVSLPAAYFTARHSFRGRRAFLYAVLVTQMFAPVALVIGIYREFGLVDNFLQNNGAPFGAVNTFWSIIAVNAAFNLAFSIWILNGYLASIPKEIEDAAMVDGAGRIRTMTRVVLPLAKPGIVTAVIFTFIQVWNEFVVAETIFNDPTRNRETLTVGINAFVGLYQTQYQYLFVASIIGIVPVVILFAVIERFLVGGLTAGSIR